ncbi:DUF3887 domain-containing protein [Cryobacterium sp. PAMC25264]|uniref:DUF3887 domain-containing protein n=1 Tax=Cryobacterium sp. PAMC25264 TaxID=2861288 RepID=UPI001C627645|nr:DUF3887 domain-containing protein [Cryobacterium sp. PAMC25264]QYF74410.1 DUF3887 domain-containing protein [Cryobacterium sp. PAMC25264]
MQNNLTHAMQELKRHTDAFLAARVLTDSDDFAGAIGYSLRIQVAAEDIVRAVVQQSRERGATWQAIGDALGVSRQAAFQRYGKPIDPRTGELMNTTPLNDAAELARSVVQDLAAGRWKLVTERFDPAMRDGLSEDALAAAWSQIVGLSGGFEGQGEPVVSRASDVTVTNTPLSMEAGDYTARIAFRDDRTIAGLHILPEQTT